AQRRDCRLHRRSRRETVVDDDDRAVAQRGKRPAASVEAVPTTELEVLADRDLLDERARNAKFTDEILGKDADAAGSDGAHRKLGMPGHAELTDEEDVERRVERLSHF